MSGHDRHSTLIAMIFAVAAGLSLIFAIAVHELGHLIAARSLKMRVDEYFIGFGPRIWSRKVRGVEVGVKAIPAGGYVKIPGMDLSGSVDDAEPGTYADRPWWAQVAVALAGPATHFVLAFGVLVLTLGFASPDPFDGAAGISVVAADSPAAAAGLESGDVVTTVDGEPVSTWAEVQAFIDGKPHAVTVERGGAQLETTVSNWSGAIIPNSDPMGGESPAAIATKAATTVIDLTDLTVEGLVGIASDLDDVFGAAAGSGPVPEERPVSIIGIVDLSGETGRSFGWFGVGILIAQINVGLALLNLIPFYPFDGGHVAAAVTNRLLRCRWLRRPVLKGMAGLSIPVLALLLALFLASSVLDVRSLG